MDVERVIDSVVARFIGTKHERDVKRIQPFVEAVNELEPEMKKLSDEQLGARTLALRSEVRERLEGVERGDSDYKQKLQDALEPAMALRKTCYVLLAARVGTTRLIDNALIEPAGESFIVTL